MVRVIKGGAYKNILVVGAETLSRIIDMQDRNTCILFGDGASAAIVSEILEDLAVPPVLMSGNHEEIRKWRLMQSLERT